MGIKLSRAWAKRMENLARQAEKGYTATISQLMSLSSDADQALTDGSLQTPQWILLKFNCSSLLINLGSDRGNREAVLHGYECAEAAMMKAGDSEMKPSLEYNIANGLSALNAIDRQAWRTAEPACPTGLLELKDRARLRRLRALYASVGSSAASADLRGRALCNLGNSLDHSGRWLEAYQAYVDALKADPTNGNAAGNAAELLRRRAALGRGLAGHYAAVYDHYRELAQRYRSRTVEVAGEAVARRWDALLPSGSLGHHSHDGDPLDEYQQWIKNHRLALAGAVEGLGSDEPRWDSALAEAVTVAPGEPDPPLIFTSMNVLKAEYLVARRLAFEGESRLRKSLFSQDPADTGTYADTLDMAIYGEPAAQLVLAQRATLDLLDKVAVAANEHFKTGVNPGGVKFPDYWRKRESDVTREGIPLQPEQPSAAVALAELAFDMDPEGLYPEAKTLRNAGTHRLVHVTQGDATGVTKLAHSSIDSETLIQATHQSLRVARSAFIYLIDLIHDQEDLLDEEGVRLPLPLPTQQ